MDCIEAGRLVKGPRMTEVGVLANVKSYTNRRKRN